MLASTIISSFGEFKFLLQNIADLNQNIFNVFEQIVKYNEHINIPSRNGNAVILSEEDYKILLDKIEFNDNNENEINIMRVSTKDGNAVIINENDYNNLVATMEISSNLILKQKVLDGLKTPFDECITEDEVEW